MSDETCLKCGRPTSGRLDGVCISRGGEACELAAQLAETSQRLEQAERVIAAADKLRGWYVEEGGATYAVRNYDTERAKFTSAGDSKPAKPPQPPQR